MRVPNEKRKRYTYDERLIEIIVMIRILNYLPRERWRLLTDTLGWAGHISYLIVGSGVLSDRSVCLGQTNNEMGHTISFGFR